MRRPPEPGSWVPLVFLFGAAFVVFCFLPLFPCPMLSVLEGEIATNEWGIEYIRTHPGWSQERHRELRCHRCSAGRRASFADLLLSGYFCY